MLTSDLNALLDQQALQRQDSECRYITDRVNWEQYETLLTRNGDSSAYRVTYLDGVLEIISPSRRHEGRGAVGFTFGGRSVVQGREHTVPQPRERRAPGGRLGHGVGDLGLGEEGVIGDRRWRVIKGSKM